MKKRFLVLFSILILSLSLIGCGKKEEPKPVEDQVGQNVEEDLTRTVVDMLGREVEIPSKPDKFVAIGGGCLRLYTYIGQPEKIVGVEEFEKNDGIKPPYSTVNTEIYSNLPTIGQGGSKGGTNPEQIISVNPDVIFATFTTDVKAADELQEKTGKPVVVLLYGQVGLFDQEIYDSFKLIGQVTGNETRAEELIGLMEAYNEDLVNRTKDVANEDKPSVYVGGLGNNGPKGIESTSGDYILLNVVNVVNVVDETGERGALIIDKEKILDWNPDYIFIDLNGYGLVKEDYGKNPNLYDSLKAVKEGRVYSQLPYVHNRSNLETAIVDAYYIGKTIYPERFEDIEISQKADEIYLNFLGETFYDNIVGTYGELGKLVIGQ